MVATAKLTGLLDCTWKFDGVEPTWRPPGSTWYGPFTKLDPFPAYTHGLEEVNATLDFVSAEAPLPWDITFWISDREDISRTNGWSQIEEQNSGEEVIAHVFLSGKRVPPHPAMTRYLIGHEYGHVIEWALNDTKNDGDNCQDSRLITEYGKMRNLGPENMHHGQGGTWHSAVDEIFACDFRSFLGIEIEYWPHMGVPTMFELDNREEILDWWEESLIQLRADNS